MQSSWKFASKPDWRLNIWSGDQKWRNGNKHRKYLEKYLHKKYLEIYLHKKLDYFCNLTFSMALYKSLAYSWTGIITSQPNPIIRKSEIWFHQKKRMVHIIIAGKDNSRRNPLVVLRHPQQKFWKYIQVSFTCHIHARILLYPKCPGKLACERKDENIFEFSTSLRSAWIKPCLYSL